jgi:integrase
VDAVLIQIAKNKTGKTVNHYAAHLKAFARHLVDRGLLESDPLKSWKKKDETPTHPHRLLTPEEIHKLLNTAPAKRRLLYRVALATGYRQAELRALTVAGLDPFGPSLKLSAPFTKNRRDARQFITQDLFAELTAASAGKKPDEPLLSVPEKSGCGENFQRDIRKAGLARASQHGKATFHSLRVCFIQAVVESGADVKAIMEAARHSSAQMSLETYAKPNVENIRQASTTAANSLLNQIESPNLAPQKAAVAGSDYETMAYAESEFGSNPGGGAIYSSVSQSLPATATFRWASVGTISRKTASAASKAAALIRPQLRSWKRQAPHSP